MNFKPSFVVLIISYVAIPSMGQVDSSIGPTGVPFPKEDLKNLNEKQKMDQSTSLTTRSGPPVGLASRLNKLEAEFREKMEDIKTQTSKSIKDQNEKIAKVIGWEHKLSHLLNQSLEVVKELKTQNKDQAKRIDQLEQKVATLQNTPPASSALTRDKKPKNGKMKNEDYKINGQVFKAFTPPSSCEELALLDHYLDGLYLVKNKQTKKIQTVFCKFSLNDKVVEEPIGLVDVKTKSVHFYVQRNSTFPTRNSVIPFQLARLNEGNAFDLSSGVFTIPVNGIYHFDFTALKIPTFHGAWIDLQVNGVSVGRAGTDQSSIGTYDVVSLSSSLRLAKGDRVNLFNWNAGSCYEDPAGRYTHFIGWLVQEDLL